MTETSRVRALLHAAPATVDDIQSTLRLPPGRRASIAIWKLRSTGQARVCGVVGNRNLYTLTARGLANLRRDWREGRIQKPVIYRCKADCACIRCSARHRGKGGNAHHPQGCLCLGCSPVNRPKPRYVALIPEVVALYRAGWSSTAIAEHFELSHKQMVCRLLHRAGEPIRAMGSKPKRLPHADIRES